MKEIVGAIIGTNVTNDRKAIAQAVATETVTEFLDRARMQFMAQSDLGPHWEGMAQGPTLFCIDDKGEIHPPNGTKAGDASFLNP